MMHVAAYRRAMFVVLVAMNLWNAWRIITGVMPERGYVGAVICWLGLIWWFCAWSVMRERIRDAMTIPSPSYVPPAMSQNAPRCAHPGLLPVKVESLDKRVVAHWCPTCFTQVDEPTWLWVGA